jgi:hypothetical protein
MTIIRLAVRHNLRARKLLGDHIGQAELLRSQDLLNGLTRFPPLNTRTREQSKAPSLLGGETEGGKLGKLGPPATSGWGFLRRRNRASFFVGRNPPHGGMARGPGFPAAPVFLGHVADQGLSRLSAMRGCTITPYRRAKTEVPDETQTSRSLSCVPSRSSRLGASWDSTKKKPAPRSGRRGRQSGVVSEHPNWRTIR